MVSPRFRPSRPLRFIHNLDRWIVTLTHYLPIDELPQDDFPISARRQDPLHMVALRPEHLGRELEFE